MGGHSIGAKIAFAEFTLFAGIFIQGSIVRKANSHPLADLGLLRAYMPPRSTEGALVRSAVRHLRCPAGGIRGARAMIRRAQREPEGRSLAQPEAHRAD